MATLNKADAESRLPELPGWTIDGNGIRKQFVFKDFPSAVDFVSRLVPGAEAADHHPDISINYRKVTLTYTTHSEGGLTEKDFAGAAIAERVFNRSQNPPSGPGHELRLKKLYTSREVAALTGLSARQLQWWHTRRLFVPSVAPYKTEAGGFTERRYTPVELLELMVLADLRRRGFSIPTIRRLLDALRSRFKVRLFEAIEGGGPLTLFIDGNQIFARTQSGELYNLLENPTQPLLMVGQDLKLRQLVAREQRGAAKRRSRKAKAQSRSVKPSSE